MVVELRDPFAHCDMRMAQRDWIRDQLVGRERSLRCVSGRSRNNRQPSQFERALCTRHVYGVSDKHDLADLLSAQLNALGSSIVSLLIFCLALVLSTPVSISRYGAKVIRVVSNLSLRVAKIVGPQETCPSPTSFSS